MKKIPMESLESMEKKSILLPEKARNGQPIGARYEAIKVLDDNGFNREKIAQALDITPRSVSKIKNQVLKKYDLMNKKHVKLAYTAQEKLLLAVADPQKLSEPLPFALKGSDVNAAIDRVYDRYQPKINKTESLNVDVSLSPIDYERLRDKYSKSE